MFEFPLLDDLWLWNLGFRYEVVRQTFSWTVIAMLQPQLLPRVGDIPRSSFQFDFGLERKVLAEAEKENPDWTIFGTEPKFPEPTPSMVSLPQILFYG